MSVSPSLTLRGVLIYKELLSKTAQMALVEDLREVARAAPPYVTVTPGGKAMSVRMTSAGACGWYSDRSGYRYAPRHPNGAAWPAIPTRALEIWRMVSGVARLPDSCLINFYGEGAHMGLHQDKDEASFDWPVVSVSLGDQGYFRIGNMTRGGKTDALWLGSGDVVVMGGAARLIWHGVDRIRFGSSTLLPKGGRINLTLRVAGSGPDQGAEILQQPE